MSERSARLVPSDPRTHLERINDWVGSATRIQEPRRDREDTPMPDGKTFKYTLKSPAYINGAIVPAGSVVELYAVQVGPHHLPIEGEKYDADHKAAVELMNRPRGVPRIDETISLDHHNEVAAGLQRIIAERDAEIAALKAKKS